jgi:hypothetical protein
MSVSIIRTGSRAAVWAGAVSAALVVTSGLAAAARPAPRPAIEPAGEPVRYEAPLEAKAEAVVLAKADQVRDSLGFPPGKGRGAKHVKDGFSRAEYDEVTDTDAAGDVLSIAQFDERGLRLAVRLDKPGPFRTAVSRDAAVKAADQASRRLGMTIDSVASVESDSTGGGWVVRWSRTVGGVRVRGDEIRVAVRADGKVGSLARVEHQLAAAPLEPIGSSRAAAIAQVTLESWSAQSESSYAIKGATLEWVEPNGIFDPTLAGAADGPYRQAWVVTVQPSGAAAEHLRLIALYIDAADGTLIGGDTVE